MRGGSASEADEDAVGSLRVGEDGGAQEGALRVGAAEDVDVSRHEVAPGRVVVEPPTILFRQQFTLNFGKSYAKGRKK